MNKPSSFGQLAERFQEGFYDYYEKSFPRMFHLCYDPIGEHKRTRAFVGFLIGLILGLVFYEVIIVDLQFGRYTEFLLACCLVTMLSIGCASSIQVRCICLLTIPTFCGRAGRSLLRALILGYIIAGPVFNLTHNGKEVVRTFACTAHLTYNLTKTRFDLIFQPFQQAILAMKSDANELKNTMSSVRDLVSPIVEEIEGEEEMTRLKEENDYLDELQGDSRRSEHIEEKYQKSLESAKSEGDMYEAKYKKKIEARCEEQLSRGSQRCRDMFADAYDKCYDKVTVFAGWLLCWPMKLTFVCNLVQALGGSHICNPDGKVDTGIGEGYATLKGTKDKLGAGLKDAKLQYKVKVAPLVLDIRGASDTAKDVMHDFVVRKKLFEDVMTIVKRCLSFVFLRIITQSQDYHEKYLSEIEFDNIYITPYFRRIDARRKARGSITVLPLKKIERKKFVEPCGLRPSTTERTNLTSQTVKLVLEVVTATTFILMDRLFFETLDIIRRHAYIEYTQAGHHDMKLEVRGTGVIASLVRSLIRGFNVKKHVKTVVTNSACLPRPSELPSYVIGKIYGSYLAIWLMIFFAAYTQRLRRAICSFFYRKREKRRVLYLYNETLRRRIGRGRFMRAKIRRDVRARRLEFDANPWLTLKTRWPSICGWLEFFAWARDKCLICGEVEARGVHRFLACTTPGCPFVYCAECWTDIGRICFACAELSDSDSEPYDTQHTDH